VLAEWVDEALRPEGRWMIVAALVLTAVAAAVRRRIDVLAIGALASAALAMALVAQSGVVATRYYIPAYALVAVALASSVARLPRLIQGATIAVAVLVFLPAAATHEEVSAWAKEEQRHAALIRTVAEQQDRGCFVAAAGLDVEPAAALLVLVELERGRERELPPCGSERYLLAGPQKEGAALVDTCAPRALERVLKAGDVATIYRCDRLRP
jgi:hypothetical protein